MDDLLQQGITAYKAGKRDEARKIFITLVKQNQDNERAWGGMYEVSNDDKERIYCLKQMLRINPKNEKANQLLNQLLAPPLPIEVNSPNATKKKCPFCAELIQAEAIVCRYCGRELTKPAISSEPMATQERVGILQKKLNERSLSNPEIDSTKKSEGDLASQSMPAPAQTNLPKSTVLPSATERECPFCRKIVNADASICPYCHSQLVLIYGVSNSTTLKILLISVAVIFVCVCVMLNWPG